MEKTQYWKRAWKVISGNCSESGFPKEIFEETQDYILEGPTMYRPYNEDSYNKCIQLLVADDKPVLREFVFGLSEALNLESGIAWSVLVNYMTNEYYGKKDLQQLMKDSLVGIEFIATLWEFYTQERSYLIRILSCILENCRSQHPFRDNYLNFVTTTTVKKIRQCLFSQMKYLIKEIPESTSNDFLYLKRWAQRNNTEQIRVLLSILNTIVLEGLDMEEIMEMLSIFDLHKFTFSPSPLKIRHLVKPNTLRTSAYIEFAIFIVGIQNFWKDSNLWFPRIEEIEKLFKEATQGAAIPILSLTWVALVTTLPSYKNQEFYNKYVRQYLDNAFVDNVFMELEDMLSHPIFKDTLAGSLMNLCVYHMMEALFVKLTPEKLSLHEGALQTVCQLIRRDNVAELCLSGTSVGVKAFIDMQFHMFPYKFESLCAILEALLCNVNFAVPTVKGLCTLYRYTEPLDESLNIVTDKIYLHEEHRPLGNDVIVFKKGCVAEVMNICDTKYLSYHSTYSYFQILNHSLNALMDFAEMKRKYKEDLEVLVLAGLKVYAKIVKVAYSTLEEVDEIRKTSQLARFLFHLASSSSLKNLNLMKVCTDIMLNVYVRNPDLVESLLDTKLLPFLPKGEFKEDYYYSPNELSSSTLLSFLDDETLSILDSDLLLTYLDFMLYCVETSKYHMEVQIPGFTYLLSKALPTFASKLFSSNIKIQDAVMKLILLIHHVLEKDISDLKIPELVVYKYLIHSFLTQSVIFKSLLEVFKQGNDTLETFLNTEMNWNSGPAINVTSTICRALQCVKTVLVFVPVNNQNMEKYPFIEKYLYSWDHSRLSTLKIISTYLNHTFCHKLRIAALELLTAFIWVSDRSVVPPLQMARQQIQQMFVDPLYDKLEDDDFKSVVIRFIIACIHKQGHLGLLFFNEDDCIEDNLVNYVFTVVCISGPKPTFCSHKLQCAVLELICSLWSEDRISICNKLLEKEYFWRMLAIQLLKMLEAKSIILIRSLDIFIMQMAKNTEHSKDFITFACAIMNMFSKFANSYKEYFSLDPPTTHEFFDSELLLTAWLKFLISVKLAFPEQLTTAIVNYKLHKRCIDCITEYIKRPRDGRILKMWTEMYLLFNTLTLPEEADEMKEIFVITSNILPNLNEIYSVLDNNTKLTLTTFILTILRNSGMFLREDPQYTLAFFKALWKPYNSELLIILNLPNKPEALQKEESYLCWMLIVNMLNTFLCMRNIKDYELSYVHNRYLENFLHIVKVFPKHTIPTRIFEVILCSLVEYADSGLVRHFGSIPLDNFYLVMLPDSKYFLANNSFPTGIIPQHLKEWWQIYHALICFNRMLLEKRKGAVANSILSFVYMHYDIISDILLSATILADQSNLIVVISILRLLHGVLEYINLWSAQNRSTLLSFVSNLKEIINASVSVILRPEILAFALNNPPVPKRDPEITVQNRVPEGNFLLVIERLLEVFTWSCMCLNRVNPSIISLLDFYKPNFSALIECDFRVPPIISENPKVLTYGALLSMQRFLSKALTPGAIAEVPQLLVYMFSTLKAPDDPVTEPNAKHYLLGPCEPEELFSVLIYPSYTKAATPKVDPLQEFYVPLTMGLHVPWIIHLNANKLSMALQVVNTFLAGQVFLTLHDVTIDQRTMRYIKRELCFELESFYAFVTKKIHNEVMDMSPRFEYLDDDANVDEENQLIVDVEEICTGKPENKKTVVSTLDHKYLLILTHWFRHVCRLVIHSKFNEFMSKWHAKSTCLVKGKEYVRYASANLTEDEDEDED